MASLKGIGWMILAGILFAGVTGVVRHLGTDMEPVQAAFIRYVIGLVILSPLLFRARQMPIITKRLGRSPVEGGATQGVVGCSGTGWND